MLLKAGTAVVAIVGSIAVLAHAGEGNPIESRVPPSELASAKALKNPIPMTAENIAKGRLIYENKGQCIHCHGEGGKGDGPAGKVLNPSPRDFTNPNFHGNRTDGEMFWVIKNGSKESGMMPMIGRQITESEAWYVILYERSFNGRK
jgi:mono/diheme cytochrome c family protein